MERRSAAGRVSRASRGDAIAIKFQLLIVLIALDVQVHFYALQQFIKMLEGQVVLADDWLQLAVDGQMRRFRGAGAEQVGAPGSKLLPAALGRHRFVVGDVVDFAAKR